ncbi:MAG: FkbM family methyltransferase [Ectothiorhodospiraceae bacterium]|nr:FkbM family methyltransferase [Ectothiorhodospiraceae bacterium]
MSLARALGLVRSLAMYHGMPWRRGRLARLYAPFVPRGSLCFDIGAHAGNRVACWRRLGARVVAVEPQRDFACVLDRLFGRDPGVRIVRVALGARRGVGTLLVSERHPTVSTLSRAWSEEVSRGEGFRTVRWSREEPVRVTTLDALIRRYGVPAFVKIDVEGLEAEVLAGLSRPVPALSFEYLPAAPASALACIDRLRELGDYRYRWSPGESHILHPDDWLDTDAMAATLRAMPPSAPSGDVYGVGPT